MILRHSSGSCCSARSIEPMTSANSTVTCLRSPSSGAASSSVLDLWPPRLHELLPHELQKRWPAELSAPQLGHCCRCRGSHRTSRRIASRPGSGHRSCHTSPIPIRGRSCDLHASQKTMPVGLSSRPSSSRLWRGPGAVPKRASEQSGRRDLNSRPFGPQPNGNSCRCVRERPIVQIVHRRGRPGHIGRSGRYQSGTTHVVLLAYSRSPAASRASSRSW